MEETNEVKEIKGKDKNRIFESLMLTYREGASILTIGQFFEDKDNDNELYLIHKIQEVRYNKEINLLEVIYICEKIHSDARDEFQEHERQSLLVNKNVSIISFLLPYEEVKEKGSVTSEFYKRVNYQREILNEEGDLGREIAFLLENLEHVEFVKEDVDSEELFLGLHFEANPLLPVPETDKQQILNIIRKSKFNIIKQ